MKITRNLPQDDEGESTGSESGSRTPTLTDVTPETADIGLNEPKAILNLKESFQNFLDTPCVLPG